MRPADIVIDGNGIAVYYKYKDENLKIEGTDILNWYKL